MSRAFVAASSQYLTSPLAVGGKPMTMLVWFKGDTAADAIPLSHMNTAATRAATTIEARLGGFNSTRDQVQDDGSNTALMTVGSGLTLGTWFSAVLKVSAGGIATGYLNGGSKTSSGTTLGNILTLNSLNIGRRGGPSSGSYFGGRIGHVALWDVELSDAEILGLHNGDNPSTVQPTQLTFYYSMEDDTFTPHTGADLTNFGTTFDGADNPPVDPAVPPIPPPVLARIPYTDAEDADLVVNAPLVWDGAKWKVGVAQGSGGAALGDLTDVDTTGQADGDHLIRDLGIWKPTTQIPIPVNLTDLQDVNTSGQADGDHLVRSGGVWVPETPAGGGGGAWTFLETITGTNVASAETTIAMVAGRNYALIIRHLRPSTQSASAHLRVRRTGQPSFDAGVSDYGSGIQAFVFNASAFFGNNNLDRVELSGQGMHASQGTYNATLWMGQRTGGNWGVHGSASFIDDSVNIRGGQITAWRQLSAEVQFVRFQMSTGNIARIEADLYEVTA